MFNDKLKGRVLIVFSDPGGAKPCMSLADTIEENSLLVLSDRKYSFYDDFNSGVTLIGEGDKIEEYIEKFNPTLIFTGTSYTSIIEKKVLYWAKQKNIKTFSFVDHWTSIADRFRDNHGKLNLPNEVWVLDERAKNIAIQEGISAEDIYISGNPYHEWLKNWKPKTDRKLFFNLLGLEGNKKYILFAPDPLSNINGIEKYGFDEYSASEKMVEYSGTASDEFKTGYHFLIKMHPNQSVEALKEIFDEKDNFTILPPEINTNESIYFSNVVIGFFSSLLIEADIMNKPVIRFLENKLKADPFLGLDLGVISNASNLQNSILKYAI